MVLRNLIHHTNLIFSDNYCGPGGPSTCSFGGPVREAPIKLIVACPIWALPVGGGGPTRDVPSGFHQGIAP